MALLNQVMPNAFHAPWLEATVHARVPESLEFVALGQVAVMVGFYLNGHEEDVGSVKDRFTVGVLLRVI